MGRPPIGKVAMTGAERIARYRAKHGLDKPATKQTKPDAALAQELAKAKARIRELEQAALAKTDAVPPVTKQTKPDAGPLEAQIRKLEAELARERNARAAAEAKVAKLAAKPKLPPDEVRDNQIKRLQTDKRNLRAQLDNMRLASNVPFATKGAVAKVLRRRREATDAEFDDAEKRWNAFISDVRTASRHR
jgi:chromosome segregation ATPase